MDINSNIDNPQQQIIELISRYKEIANELKTNILRLDILINREKENFSKTISVNQLISHKEELRRDFKFMIELINFENDRLLLNNTPLTPNDINKFCSCYYNNQWINAKVLNLNYSENEKGLYQEYVDVLILLDDCELKNKSVNLPFNLVKVNKTHQVKDFQKDFSIDVINLSDGLYHEAKVIRVYKDFIEVEFVDKNLIEKISYNAVRISPIQKRKNEEMLSFLKENEKMNNEKDCLSEDEEKYKGFVIPDNLRLLSTDDEQQKLAKRKKVKALKQNFKQKILEKENKGKQDNWLSFVSTNSTSNNINRYRPGMNIKKYK